MSYKPSNLLDNLFGVKARVLKLFLQRPQLVLSANELAKRTNIKKRETEKLVFYFTKMGFLKKVNGNGKPRSRISK
ncbi:MAG: hypothetical protein HY219_02435 [Candidatus Staskawiczbacteria bacterium]|nr:hypothetical protein [Candidatus Staskawiczbacteria bacterium]